MKKILLLLLIIILTFSNVRPEPTNPTILAEGAAADSIGVQVIDLTNFVSKWNTTLNSTGSSSKDQIKLPLTQSGGSIYNFTVDWGDGNNDTITSYNQEEVIHTYIDEGEYTLVINGILIGWQFNNAGDRLKIIEISQWGSMGFGNLGYNFYGSENLELTATDAPDLTGTTTLQNAFRDCYNLGGAGSMDTWDVSSITNMFGMFYYATSFNQPIGNWNVSSVDTMGSMFGSATFFNQPISSWDVSSVTNMGYMFGSTPNFNQPIGNWNVSSVTNMYSMFSYTTSFNQPIGNWDVSSVTTMQNMFLSSLFFNQPIGNWNVSSVTNMGAMFGNTYSFNQPIGSWDVSSVTSMSQMFSRADSFDQPIGDWNISSVTSIDWMLYMITLSYKNYDDLLIKWSNLTLQNNLAFMGGNSKYSINAATARQYIIDTFGWTITDGGLAESIPPIISSPDDITYYQGTTGNQITWVLVDDNPGTYNITVDGLLDTTGNWANGIISFDIDGLDLGVHIIILNVYDMYDNKETDTVVVTVHEIIPPNITSPDDITYELGVSGNQINWGANDKNPGVLNVTIDGVLHYSDTWTNGTISFNVDDLEVGIHEVTIFVYDLNGNMNSDTVIVTVTKSTSETSDTIVDTQSTTSTDLSDNAPSPLNTYIFVFSLGVVVFLRRKKR